MAALNIVPSLAIQVITFIVSTVIWIVSYSARRKIPQPPEGDENIRKLRRTRRLSIISSFIVSSTFAMWFFHWAELNEYIQSVEFRSIFDINQPLYTFKADSYWTLCFSFMWLSIIVSAFLTQESILNLLRDLNSSDKKTIDRERNRYSKIQLFVSNLHFYFTIFSALMMIIIFLAAFFKLLSAVVQEISARIPVFLGGKITYIGTSHEIIVDVLSTVELLIVAPLPYLLMLGLGRYINEIAHDNDAKNAKAELLDFKAFEVSLLIAIVATAMISRILSHSVVNGHLQPADLHLPSFGAASLLLILLIGYFYILEFKSSDGESQQPNSIRQAKHRLSEFELNFQQGDDNEARDHLFWAIASFQEQIDLDPNVVGAYLYARGCYYYISELLEKPNFEDINYIESEISQYRDHQSRLKIFKGEVVKRKEIEELLKQSQPTDNLEPSNEDPTTGPLLSD
ncbi:MAG: hypothetical protein KF836_04610 [Fimbriimonadaceae bacterium]|nr:hypothetical protein [Fimbriimonadaceae bacterium]